MPSTWYTYRDNKIKAEDSEEIKQAKEFNIKIAATKKPYFMIYVYPRLKSELSTYKKNSDKNAIRNFSEYGVHSVQDIIDHPCPTDEMIQYYEYYKKLLPVGDNACIVNQIAWHFENEFNSLLTKMPNLIKQTYNTEFDYNILKCGVAYSNITYNKILKLYKLHNLQVNKVMQKGSEEKVDRFDNHMEYEILLNIFKSRCYEICSNREELCDIILDICYTHEKSKQFAWDICSDIMLENLLKKSGGNISFPTPSDDDYDFEYSGRKFKMTTINVSEVNE